MSDCRVPWCELEGEHDHRRGDARPAHGTLEDARALRELARANAVRLAREGARLPEQIRRRP